MGYTIPFGKGVMGLLGVKNIYPMNSLKHSFGFLFIVFLLSSCTADEDNTPQFNCAPVQAGNGAFLRVESFGPVSVVPEDRQVRILVGVSDSLGNGVDNLTIQDFQVLENCEDKVNDLEAQTQIDDVTIPFTIRTVLLLDISSSLEGQIADMKAAVNALLDAKLPEQEFALFSFDSQVQLLQDFTSDVNQLKSIINQLPESGLDASTNLYQAIIDGANVWEDIRTVDQIIAGSMIVFTDGKHNADPTLTIEDVSVAIENKVTFIAALDGPNLDSESLQKIAKNEENYLAANQISLLDEVFLNIQQKVIRESNSTYFITYTSPISVTGNQNLRVLLQNNRNAGSDAFVDLAFSTEGF